MDTTVEERRPPPECCIACLTRDENKLSNANAAGLLKDFLPQRDVSIVCVWCLVKYKTMFFSAVITLVQVHSSATLH